METELDTQRDVLRLIKKAMNRTYYGPAFDCLKIAKREQEFYVKQLEAKYD